MTLRRVMIWLQPSAPFANRSIIAAGAKIAAEHGAELNAIITTPKLSRSGHWAVGGLVSSMSAEVEARSESTAQDLVRALDHTRAAAGLKGVSKVQTMAPHLFGDFLAMIGRTSDLVIAGATTDEDARGQIEAMIFGVARPVLLLPAGDEGAGEAVFSPTQVALAWDGSRAATRAAFDALPVLKRARKVTLIQIADDKDLSTAASIGELRALMTAHGVETDTLEVLGRGKPTNLALQDAFEQSQADVLVMGAYGHSRAREFVLGGATRGTLQASAFPVLLSH